MVVEPYIPCWRCRYCATGSYQLYPRRRIYGVNMSCAEPPHLWGGYGEYLYVAPGSRVHRIARHVRPEAATLSSVIGNGVRWIATKGQLRVGEAVAIIGPGALGLASTMVADYCGAGAVILIGLAKDENRLRFATGLGATHTLVAGEMWPQKAQVSRACLPEAGSTSASFTVNAAAVTSDQTAVLTATLTLDSVESSQRLPPLFCVWRRTARVW